MKSLKYKHLTLEDRLTIQEYLNSNYNFSNIAKSIGKNRRTISKEVYKHRLYRTKAASDFEECKTTSFPPYVCNGCQYKTLCKKIKYTYDAVSAHNEYLSTLVNARANLQITKEQIADINDVLVPLMIDKHHSINQLYINHPDLLPFAKSTFYKYIDLRVFNVRNIDLQRKTKYRVKKELALSRQVKNPKIKIGRFFTNFNNYINLNPDASIVEMDTVIGTNGGKGGKCFLTLLFRKYNFMLIYLLPYKQSKYVVEVFNKLKKLLGPDEFKRLFEVILTDNGTEFSDPESIEIDWETGEKLSSVFFCDPNCSWQKGSIEKNHEYIRYVLPKGTSFAGLNQDDCFKLASHINSVPRVSLNNSTPYQSAILFIGRKNMDKFNIYPVFYDDVDISPRLLSK